MLDPLTKYLMKRSNNPSDQKKLSPVLLMYHGTIKGRRKPFSDYSTSSTKFRAQLDLLRKFGWDTRCVRDLSRPDTLPSKTAVLTFDDGYEDNYEGAYWPLLQRGMRATWFVVTSCIGSHAHWLGSRSTETNLLSLDQLRNMSKNGMEIGSHTSTHPDLTTLSQSSLDREIINSRLELEDILGQKVQSFAYPFGRFDERSIRTVRRARYTHACSARPGWLHSDENLFVLRRVTIFSHDSLGDFARKLIFAENEMGFSKVIHYILRRLVSRMHS